MESDSITRSSEGSSRETHRKTTWWNFFGQRLPRSEIVFFCQMILIYVIVGVSLYNLSTDHSESDKLWIALLGSCLGYVLPNPSIDRRPQG